MAQTPKVWVCGLSNKNPAIISVIPDRSTIKLGDGIYKGIMRSYIFGVLK